MVPWPAHCYQRGVDCEGPLPYTLNIKKTLLRSFESLRSVHFQTLSPLSNGMGRGWVWIASGSCVQVFGSLRSVGCRLARRTQVLAVSGTVFKLGAGGMACSVTSRVMKWQ